MIDPTASEPGAVAQSEPARPVLLLRLAGPLMAFGEPLVDQHGWVGDFPGLAMLTGLCANALGLHHREHEHLNRLQARLRYAALRDRAGDTIIDYQTVDLSQPSLVGTAWTTRHRVEERGKGEATTGTHIRYRHYRAGARVYVALSLNDAEEGPTIEELATAIQKPARPLFLGRKTCIPSAPIYVGMTRAVRLIDAFAEFDEIAKQELSPRDPASDRVMMWPYESPSDDIVHKRMVVRVDGRDWRHQQHMGERRVWIGRPS